ncbi:MAG: N-acetyl-gamma-glutamyl-phosphate reductase [Bdellovibrionales bacterium]|nr:N-acetyl-gamma-glutamyl-phosphate reductase [Bdellovibrionales bacterium]
MEKSIGVAIVGGTGYGAGELLRLLTAHPSAEVASVVSSSLAGEEITQAHPHLEGFYGGTFGAEFNVDDLAGYRHRVAFLCLPHGASGEAVKALFPVARSANVKLIDLSGDLRLSDAEQRQRNYPEAGVDAELQAHFVYGLPELFRSQIARADAIANPGCYPTACSLAVAPLMDCEITGSIAFDAKSGSSGAGRNLQAGFHHPERHANVNAYKVLSHRHEAEIRQALGDPSGSVLATTFVPHVIPVSRGIYATVHLELEQEMTTNELLLRYQEFYRESPFVRVRTDGVALENVVGSNFCDVSVWARGRQVVACAALDNLVKGMAGQAIQNMNSICGLPETTGLWQPALRPM